jgi:hypothetical protein
VVALVFGQRNSGKLYVARRNCPTCCREQIIAGLVRVYGHLSGANAEHDLLEPAGCVSAVAFWRKVDLHQIQNISAVDILVLCELLRDEQDDLDWQANELARIHSEVQVFEFGWLGVDDRFGGPGLLLEPASLIITSRSSPYFISGRETVGSLVAVDWSCLSITKTSEAGSPHSKPKSLLIR